MITMMLHVHMIAGFKGFKFEERVLTVYGTMSAEEVLAVCKKIKRNVELVKDTDAGGSNQ